MTIIMKLLGAAGLTLIAAPAWADSPFDGTWKAQLSSMKMQAKPDVILIRNGIYQCKTCQPSAYSVPADGQFHPVAGRPYWDDVSVTTVDDHAARFQFRKGGKVISTNTWTVSADGGSLVTQSLNTNNGGNVPIESTGGATRVGAPVAGAHLVSGTWQFAPATAVSDAALTVKLRVNGKQFHQEVGLGESLDATIGGPYALNQGDPGKTMTKVERPSDRVLRMTDMRGGKVVSVSTYTLSADGASLTGMSRDAKTGDTSEFTALRQ